MKNPKVSVVIPAYNHEKYVGEAIQSVLDQTFQDFELIVINDGSTDNTQAEILRFKDERIRYFSQENRGLSATLNRGIELARAEYFSFLSSDDVFYPEKLDLQIKAFEGKPGLGLVFSYPELIDAEGRAIQDEFVTQWPIVPYETKEEIFPALFERNFLSAPTAFIKMDCLKRVGLFDESLKYAQDYDMWMRILKYYDICLLKQPLVKYRWHGQNLTYQATSETEFERAKVLLKAYKNLSIEEVFPNLQQKREPSDYAEAYKKLADHMGKSSIPALFPIAKIYEDQGVSLKSSIVPLTKINGVATAKGGEVKIQEDTFKKIHVLMEALSLDRGGLEQVIFNLAKGLGRDIFKVVLVGVEKGGGFAQRAKEIGIPVEILQYDKTKEYQEILERYQIDIVVSHYSTFGARLAFEKGIPSLSVVHNIYSWFPDNVLSDFKTADPFVSRYVAVSEDVKRYTHYRFNIPSEKIVVIPNGIDVEEFTGRPSSKTLDRSELGLEEEDYIFINVASVGPPKGQNVILAALRQIVKTYPQIKVLSVGEVLDDGFFNFLKKKIEEFQLSDHFKFIGVVDDVKPYLQMADAFLLTSFIEGWPVSVMEAMLQQLPVLLTRVGGVEAILGESRAGIILDNNYEDLRFLDVPSLDNLSGEESPRNAEEVAKAMVRFFKEKKYWKRAGYRGYRRVSKYFNLQEMIRTYERELVNLFSITAKTKEQHLSGKVLLAEKLLDAKEHLLQEREKAVQTFRSQEAYYRETLESKLNLLESKTDTQNEALRKQVEDLPARIKEITESNLNLLGSKLNLLESKTDVQYEDMKRRVEYVLLRLSLTERLKGVIYRLMKKVHLLLPVSLREKYRSRYRKIFFNKVIPTDKKVFEEKILPPERTESAEVQEVIMVRDPERKDPIQGFWRFKEEISKGLSLEFEKFQAPSFPNLVSVVLPVYNQAYLLGDAIESVRNQTYPSMELIVVNDGSTDAIGPVLDRYRGNPKVTIIEQKNQKLPMALSNGFLHAKGEFYTWTSADNLMDPRQLELQVDFFKKNPRVQMVYSNYHLIDDEGNPLLNSDYCPGYQKPPGSNHISLPKDPSELNVIRNNYIGPCFMYRSWVGRLIGDYDSFMFTLEDYDYWMTTNSFFRIEHLGREDFIYFNRVHENSLTGRKKELKIVESTDKLMVFEEGRREFYRKKFNIYLIGNHDGLGGIKRFYEENGNHVQQLNIPWGDIKMVGEKVVGIWIFSNLEKGFIHRMMRGNPQAFFVAFVLNGTDGIEDELLKNFGMILRITDKHSEKIEDCRWFYSEKIPFTLYPILCKANIVLFRKKESFRP